MSQKLLVTVSVLMPDGWSIGMITDWVEQNWRSALGHQTECVELRADHAGSLLTCRSESYAQAPSEARRYETQGEIRYAQ
jgi:hypothetical protein